MSQFPYSVYFRGRGNPVLVQDEDFRTLTRARKYARKVFRLHAYIVQAEIHDRQNNRVIPIGSRP